VVIMYPARPNIRSTMVMTDFGERAARARSLSTSRRSSPLIPRSPRRSTTSGPSATLRAITRWRWRSAAVSGGRRDRAGINHIASPRPLTISRSSRCTPATPKRRSDRASGVLWIRELALGSDHLDVATSLSNLAGAHELTSLSRRRATVRPAQGEVRKPVFARRRAQCCARPHYPGVERPKTRALPRVASRTKSVSIPLG